MTDDEVIRELNVIEGMLIVEIIQFMELHPCERRMTPEALGNSINPQILPQIKLLQRSSTLRRLAERYNLKGDDFSGFLPFFCQNVRPETITFLLEKEGCRRGGR